MLDHIGVAIEGQEAVVVGRSNIVGKPMALMLLQPQRDSDNLHLPDPRSRRITLAVRTSWWWPPASHAWSQGI